ncbi:helix-turn-helix transcriptional regulator [Desulfosoma sp.]|uniref:helix-turn-helix transcriptional regulator n=1 Tax=Desulfosoma sp. TaxID=2603217 RepID=UPI00404B9F3E
MSKLLQVVDCLAKPQGAGLKELREALECDERTVYQWIGTIEYLGFPVEGVQGKNPKSYRLIKSYVKKLPNIAIPNFDLSLSDIILIHVVLSQDRVTRGTQMKSRIENLLKRLRAYLSEDDQRRVEALERLAILNPRPQKDYSQKEDIIECLTNAILQKKRCLVKYYSFHKKKEYRFPTHPLHFFESQGGLYVMVQLAEMKKPVSCVVDTLRVLAVERIQEITLLKETFEYPEGLNPYELLSQAFDVVWNDPVEAKIWFSNEAAPYVKERVWPGRYTIEENSDGSLYLHLKTSGYDNVKRWILSFGNDAWVIEPPRLKRDVAETCRKMADGYFRKTGNTLRCFLRAGAPLRSAMRPGKRCRKLSMSIDQ